jgi:hypothetical protein
MFILIYRREANSLQQEEEGLPHSEGVKTSETGIVQWVRDQIYVFKSNSSIQADI